MLLFNNIENAVVWLYWFLNWCLLLLFYTFDSLPWQTLDDRRCYAKSVLMYKILNDHIALVPRNSFVRRNVNQTNYHLRDTATDLTLSKPKREILKRSFKFSVAMLTGKNNGFPFLDILGYLKNTHKNPKFGKVRQVPTKEFPTKFPDWDLSHSSKFGIFVGIL